MAVLLIVGTVSEAGERYYRFSEEGLVRCGSLLSGPSLKLINSFFSNEDLDFLRERTQSERQKSSYKPRTSGAGGSLFQTGSIIQTNGKLEINWKYSEDNPETLGILKRAIEKTAGAIEKKFKSGKNYLDQRRFFTVEMATYAIKPGRKKNGLPWHRDRFDYQIVVPIEVPRNLSGGDLRVSNDLALGGAVIENRRPTANRGELFEKSWHMVTGMSNSSDKVIYRTIFLIGFGSRAWKDLGRPVWLDDESTWLDEDK